MNTLTLERSFPVPVEKVWDALTNEDILKKWWSPEGMETPHISVDLQTGGIFGYCMRTPDGQEFWGRGIYQTITQPEFLSFLDTFTDAKGNPVPSSHYGMSGKEIVESLVEFRLTETNGVTTLSLVGENPHDDAMLEEMKKGWDSMFDKLEALLR